MGVQNERQPQTYRVRPEPGQLVEVRRRQWVVADVDASGLDAGAPQHCVTLSSIDEDGLGEQLEVVWEIEPGAQIIERAGLPSVTGQDDSDMLDELEKSIQSELKKELQPEQLSLFTEDERTQLRRDVAALETRLKRIPDERRMETQAIESRYAKIDARTFPVAVIFVVPKENAKGNTR